MTISKCLQYMHLDFRVKPENDRKDTFGTSPFFYAAEDLESFPYKEDYQFCELRADLYGILCFVNSGVIPRNDGALEGLQAKVIELWKKEHEKK